MREIKLFSWDEKNAEGKTEKINLVNVLKLLLTARDPQKMPRGIDQHRLFRRLDLAFEKAEETQVLKLEEADYSQLKKIIDEDIPATWGLNKDISKAIEDFLEAPQKE